MQQYIGFKLDGSEFTIPILKVREIINTPSFTRLPNSPDFMRGIINLRGRIVPILDLRELVASEGEAVRRAPASDAGGKIIVVASQIGGGFLGMLVDSITSVINIKADDIEPPEGLVNLERIEGVVRFDDRMVILLDTDKLVGEDEMEAMGRELAGIQRAADVRRLASPSPAVSAPRREAPQPQRPASPPPPKRPAPAAPPVAAAAPLSDSDDPSASVTVKDLHQAGDMLSRKFTEGDSKNRFLSEIIEVIDALATRDLDAAGNLIGKALQSAEGDLFNRIGMVTRKLHDSLKEFRHTLDPRIRRIADEEVPQAVDSLEYVIKKTEEAANKTLAIVEKHQAGLEDFESMLHDMQSPEDFTIYMESFRSALQHDLNEIMLAQEFQDITGQTIRRVIELVNTIEAELIGLIANFGVKPERSREDSAKPASEKITQDDIEDLLSEFGF